MKFNKWFLGLMVTGLIGLIGPIKGEAQSTLDTTNIFQSAEQFFADNPTNLSWIGNKLEIESTVAYQQQQQFANTLKAGYNLNDSWQIGGKIENAGIAGTVESYQASISFALINSYAIKLDAGVEPGYSHQYGSAVIEPYGAFKKKLTANTYTVFEISEPCYVEHASRVPSKWVPAEYLGVGFTYGGGTSSGQSTAWRLKMDHTATAFRHLVDPGSI